jgi:hypothetical protein
MAKADARPPTVGIIADDVDACLSIVGFLSDVNSGAGAATVTGVGQYTPSCVPT